MQDLTPIFFTDGTFGGGPMTKNPFLCIFLSLSILAIALGLASAQSSKEAEGRAAEQAGRLREALTHYVAALQSVSEGSADDQRLRETIIKLVQKLSPPPAVPEEARRFSVRGQIAIKDAKTAADFDEAAKEFGKAVRVAPWWADGYINQGVALEKAGKFNEAARALKFYLLAAPNAPDAQNVRDQIYALEYRQEKAQKEATGQREAEELQRHAQEAYQRNLGFLAGRWYGTVITHYERLVPPGRTTKYDIVADVTIDGKEIKITQIETEKRSILIRGRITGNDSSIIRWEMASSTFAYQPVSVETTTSRIRFSLPTLFMNRRYEDFQEFDLQKR